MRAAVAKEQTRRDARGDGAEEKGDAGGVSRMKSEAWTLGRTSAVDSRYGWRRGGEFAKTEYAICQAQFWGLRCRLVSPRAPRLRTAYTPLTRLLHASDTPLIRVLHSTPLSHCVHLLSLSFLVTFVSCLCPFCPATSTRPLRVGNVEEFLLDTVRLGGLGDVHEPTVRSRRGVVQPRGGEVEPSEA